MMKRKYFITLVTVMMLFCCVGNALATDIFPFSDPSFQASSIVLRSNGEAAFSARTSSICESIKVTTVILQIKVDGNWVTHKVLSAPSYVATNAMSYNTIKDYSGSMTSGNTYRIRGTFNADGSTVTCYSGSVDY